MYNYYIYIQFIAEHFLIRYANNEVIYLFSIQNVDIKRQFFFFCDVAIIFFVLETLRNKSMRLFIYFKESLYTHKTIYIYISSLPN